MEQKFKICIFIFIIISIYLLFYEFIPFYKSTGLSIKLNNNLTSINELKNIIHLEHELLTTNECNLIKQIILNDKKNWIKRKYILYSYGNCSYLGDSLYQDDINKSNEKMLNLFPNLYRKLLIYLEDKLERKVVYKKDSYLPGFHIFPETKLFQYNVADFHTDAQYKSNNWYGNCNFDVTISFTLAIDLPKDESGLYIFEATENTPLEEAKKSKRALIKYKKGNIFLHTGNNYHIMKPSKIEMNEHRITFQGHGVLCDNKWHIFW